MSPIYVWILESRETTLGLKVAFNVGRPGLKCRDVVRVRILLHTYKLKKKKINQGFPSVTCRYPHFTRILREAGT